MINQLSSMIGNAVPAWQPCLAGIRLGQSKRCQYRVLRILTGQLKTSPLETLRMQAEITSFTTQGQLHAAVGCEKAHRRPALHSRNIIFEGRCRHSVKELPNRQPGAKPLNYTRPKHLECPRHQPSLIGLLKAEKCLKTNRPLAS